MSCIYVAAISDNVSFLIATFVFLVFKIDETFVDVLYGVDQKDSAWTTSANPSSCAECYPSSASSPHL